MKAPSSFDRVYLHRTPVDMRRGIDGLCDIVASSGMGDLSTGKNLFVFTGRRRHSIKVLYLGKGGFCLWQKRLEEDRFPWPKNMTDDVVHLEPEQLAWLLDGYDIWKMKPFGPGRKFERVS